jgi:hypothetical protein
MQDELRLFRRSREENRRRYGYGPGATLAYLPLEDFPTSGLDSYLGVMSMNAVRLLPGSAIVKFLTALDCENFPENTLQFLLFVEALSLSFSYTFSDRAGVKSEIEYKLKESTTRLEGTSKVDTVGFLTALSNTEHFAIFDPWSWKRNEQQQPPDQDIRF